MSCKAQSIETVVKILSPFYFPKVKFEDIFMHIDILVPNYSIACQFMKTEYILA